MESTPGSREGVGSRVASMGLRLLLNVDYTFTPAKVALWDRDYQI